MKGLYLAHTEVGCVHVSSWGLWGLYLVLAYNLMHAILFILFSLIGLYMVVGNIYRIFKSVGIFMKWTEYGIFKSIEHNKWRICFFFYHQCQRNQHDGGFVYDALIVLLMAKHMDVHILFMHAQLIKS